MPLIEPKKIGQIIKFDWQACAPSPYLVIETLGVATLKAFFAIIEPDPKEVYHRVRGISVVKELKSAIIDASEGEPVFGARGRKFIFSVAEWADMAVWYLFLADVVAEGLYRWTSAMMRMSPCKGFPGEWGQSQRVIGGCGAGPDPASGSGTWLTGNPERPAIFATVTLLPGQTGTITMQLQGRNPFGGDRVPLTSWIEVASTGEVIASDDDWRPIDGQYGPTQMSYTATNTSEVEVTWIAHAHCPIPLPPLNQAEYEYGFLSINTR